MLIQPQAYLPWCTPAGPPSSSCSGSGTAPDKFGYDACRAPWRQGVDVLWWGNAATGNMQNVINRQSDFWIAKGGASTVQGNNNVNHDGSGIGVHNGAFVGPIGAMALASTNTAAHQQFVNELYDQLRDVTKITDEEGDRYFTAILHTIGMFVQTGNFWNPYDQVRNSLPTVEIISPANNSSICETSKITIAIDALDKDGTILKVEIYNGNTLLQTLEEAPYVYDWNPPSAGEFVLSARAYDNIDEYSETSQTNIVVTAASPNPIVLDTEFSYCSGELADQLTVSGNNLSWYIGEEMNSSNTAPIPSTDSGGVISYFVTQNTNGCESQKMEITVATLETSLPQFEEVGYCIGETPKQLVVEGVDIKWYESAQGGEPSFVAPTPTTEDISAVSYFVTQTVGACESKRAEIIVLVGNQAPIPEVSPTLELCENGNRKPFEVYGYRLKWYESQFGGVALAGEPVLNTNVLGSTSYFVSQSSTGCESDRVRIVGNVNPKPIAPSVESMIDFALYEQSVKLEAQGINLIWYDAIDQEVGTSFAPFPATDSLGSTSYFVSQTINGCESEKSEIEVVVNDLLAVGKVTLAPSINGGIDPIWTMVAPTSFQRVILGGVASSADLSGSFKLLWDDNYLYVLGEIVDDSKINDSGDSYQDDAVEIYLDFDYTNSTTYDASDVQVTCGYNDDLASANNSKDASNVSFVTTETANGYIYEAQIPWSIVGESPTEGDIHGFDFHVNDDDDGGDRDGKMAWKAISDNAWQNPSLFGSIKLTGDINLCDKPEHPMLDFSSVQICEGESMVIASTVENSEGFFVQWMDNGVPVDGANSPSFEITEMGKYSVQYTDTYFNDPRCFSISEEVSVSINSSPDALEIIGAPKACIYNLTEIYSYAVNPTFGSSYQWEVDDENIISGNGTSDMKVEFMQSLATSAVVYVTETNRYNCVGETASLMVEFDCPNGIEVNSDNESSVYPNPFDGSLFAKGFDRFEFFNLQGQLIYSGELVSDEIKTEFLEADIYLLKLYNQEVQEILKVVKR